jgi:K+-transporting ATPase KdpF subunit
MTPLGAFVGHMGVGDFFGLVIGVAICAYLLYALLRGERF